MTKRSPTLSQNGRQRRQRPPAARSSTIDLALQGGGAHGAFTWGVLDRILEEDWLEIEAISGTSAGAMNAAVLASGYAKGGRDGRAPGARAVLAQGLGRGALQPVPAQSRSTSCSGAGRSTIRRSSWPWT